MNFEKVCQLFSMQEPFYGIILSSMEKIVLRPPMMDTLGVARSGNVFRLYYNPDFVENLPVDTVLQLLKHEVLHIAFNHFTIWDDPEGYKPEPEVHNLRNIAEDLEINGYIDRKKIAKEAGGVFAEDYGWNDYEGTREYFNRLNQELQQKKQKALANMPTQPCDGGQGGQSGQQNNQPQQQNQQQNQPSQGKGQSNQKNSQNQQGQANNQGQTPNNQPQQSQPQNQNGSGLSQEQQQRQQMTEQATNEFFRGFQPFDDHSRWPTNMTKNEEENLQQVIDDMLVFAADEVEKGRGYIPGELAGRIEKLRKKPKPVADWKRYFRRYMGNEFTELLRKSKKRESLRFPDAAGNRHQRKSNILVAIDTSGSVSMPEYMEFMGQIKTLSQRASFKVLECDACIQYEYEYRGKPNEILHGGGGTAFEPVVDYFIQNKKKYDALVYFTDGGAPIPKNTPKETLWVVSSIGDKDSKRYKVNGASVVFIPPHKTE